MSSIWTDKVIVITGASAGIGAALASVLALQTPKLVLAARDQRRLEGVAESCEQLGARTLVVPTDVANSHACAEMVERTVEKFSRIDVLVNNAGISMWATLEDLEDVEHMKQVMDVNFLGSAFCTKFALPYLKQTRGRIVAVSSLAGLTGVPSHAAYCASKHAMNGFFESLRIELDGTGVSVTIVVPDFVQSEIFSRSLGTDGKPLGRKLKNYDSFLSAEACAGMIIKAMAQRERLVLTSLRGKLGRWVKLGFPQIIDWMAKKSAAKAYHQ